jgi:type IV secretion system protein VirB9
MRALRLLAMLVLLAWPGAGLAAVTPQPGPGDPRIQVVPYVTGEVIELRATYGFEMTLEFDPGERLENIAIGDSAAWQITPSKRGDLLFIKPVKHHAPTDMTVITSLRRYDFNLRAEVPGGGRAPIFGVRFEYPALAVHDAVVLKATPPTAPAPPPQPEAVGVRYSYEGSPALIPARVFDDGEFTYFKFSSNEDYPAIYVIGLDGKESVVNFSVRQGYIVVDKIAPGFVLRQGRLVAQVYNDAFKGPAPTADSPTPHGRKGWF